MLDKIGGWIGTQRCCMNNGLKPIYIGLQFCKWIPFLYTILYYISEAEVYMPVL